MPPEPGDRGAGDVDESRTYGVEARWRFQPKRWGTPATIGSPTHTSEIQVQAKLGQASLENFRGLGPERTVCDDRRENSVRVQCIVEVELGAGLDTSHCEKLRQAEVKLGDPRLELLERRVQRNIDRGGAIAKR